MIVVVQGGSGLGGGGGYHRLEGYLPYKFRSTLKIHMFSFLPLNSRGSIVIISSPKHHHHHLPTHTSPSCHDPISACQTKAQQLRHYCCKGFSLVFCSLSPFPFLLSLLDWSRRKIQSMMMTTLCLKKKEK